MLSPLQVSVAAPLVLTRGRFDPQQTLVQLVLALDQAGQGAGDGVHSFLIRRRHSIPNYTMKKDHE